MTSGIFHVDTIKDIADSLGIVNLPENVATMLASDVEYRLNQVIEEAARFTRHSKRTTLSTSDIDQAFKVLNIEPVYGHSRLNAPAFRRVVPAVGQAVYAPQDEEIDFDKTVREEEIPVPRAVSWTAHWLAIEGVQPLIPENPPPPHMASANGSSLPGSKAKPSAVTSVPSTSGSKPSLTTKAHLSRELQQYYARLTDSLLPGDDRKRTAALSSLRNDAGLQGILPYLVKWVGDNVVGALAIKNVSNVVDDDNEEDVDRPVLEVMLMVIHAVLDNKRLFVEPYLHMMLPPLLSILLTSTLSSSSSYSSLPSQPSPTPKALRIQASNLVAHLLRLHSASYPSLAPRITKTFLLSLLNDSNRTTEASTQPPKSVALGTKDGAIRGLMSVGHEAVRRGIVEGRSAKSIGTDIERTLSGKHSEVDADMSVDDLSGLGGETSEWTEEVQDVVASVLDALALLQPLPGEDGLVPFSFEEEDSDDDKSQLIQIIGPLFADLVLRKSRTWGSRLAQALQGRGNVTWDANTLPLETAQPFTQEEGADDWQNPINTSVDMSMGGDLGALDAEAMDAT